MILRPKRQSASGTKTGRQPSFGKGQRLPSRNEAPGKGGFGVQPYTKVSLQSTAGMAPATEETPDAI